jgi:3-oxoacyl-[acyl-carrier-protein] synthase-3
MAIFSFSGIRVAAMAAAMPTNEVRPDDFKVQFGEEEVEKFKKMTGVVSSRKASYHQTTGDLGYVAAEKLLAEKNINKAEIGALVVATHSPDYPRPATAFIVQKRLGLDTECVCFDISLGCSAVVYGIQVLSSMMMTSNIRKALLISGDTGSKTVNPRDKSKVMLGGDVGVCLLLERTDNLNDEIHSLVRSDGNGYRYLIVPGGGCRNMNPPHNEVMCEDGIERSLYDSFMRGTSVFTFTVFDVPKIVKDFLVQTNTSIDDYDCFAFHQANLYILQQIAKKARIPADKMPITLPKYGNTSGASPVVSMCDKYGNDMESKKINVMLCGFGIGLSWGVTSFWINTDDILPIIFDDTVFEEGIISDPNELFKDMRGL